MKENEGRSSEPSAAPIRTSKPRGKPKRCWHGAKCTTPNCPFTHPKAKEAESPKVDEPKAPQNQQKDVAPVKACRFGAECRNPESCPFSHPTEEAKHATETKPGARVEKEAAQGKSAEATNVSHSQPPPTKKKCKFGAKCKKRGTCRFVHPDEEKQEATKHPEPVEMMLAADLEQMVLSGSPSGPTTQSVMFVSDLEERMIQKANKEQEAKETTKKADPTTGRGLKKHQKGHQESTQTPTEDATTFVRPEPVETSAQKPAAQSKKDKSKKSGHDKADVLDAHASMNPVEETRKAEVAKQEHPHPHGANDGNDKTVGAKPAEVANVSHSQSPMKKKKCKYGAKCKKRGTCLFLHPDEQAETAGQAGGSKEKPALKKATATPEQASATNSSHQGKTDRSSIEKPGTVAESGKTSVSNLKDAKVGRTKVPPTEEKASATTSKEKTAPASPRRQKPEPHIEKKASKVEPDKPRGAKQKDAKTGATKSEAQATSSGRKKPVDNGSKTTDEKENIDLSPREPTAPDVSNETKKGEGKDGSVGTETSTHNMVEEENVAKETVETVARASEEAEETEEEKKARWREELRRQKERAAEKKAKKKERRHSQYMEEQERMAQERTDFWEKEKDFEKKGVEMIILFCASEYSRHSPSVTRIELMSDSAFRSKLEDVARKAFRDLYDKEIHSRIQVKGMKQSTGLNDRLGTIQHWDEDKEKFYVGLDTGKGKKPQYMFISPVNLEAVSGAPAKKKREEHVAEVHFPLMRGGYHEFVEVKKSYIDAMLNARSVDKYLNDLMTQLTQAEEEETARLEQERQEEEERRRRRMERLARERREAEERRRQYEEYLRAQAREREERRRAYGTGQHNDSYCDCPRCQFEREFARRIFEDMRFQFGGGYFGGRGGGFRRGFASSFPFFMFEEEGSDYDYMDEDEEEAIQEAAAVLGVEVDATESEIRRKYYQLCRLYHPDKYRPENHQDGTTKDEAEEQFKKISHSYEIMMKQFEDE